MSFSSVGKRNAPVQRTAPDLQGTRLLRLCVLNQIWFTQIAPHPELLFGSNVPQIAPALVARWDADTSFSMRGGAD